MGPAISIVLIELDGWTTTEVDAGSREGNRLEPAFACFLGVAGVE